MSTDTPALSWDVGHVAPEHTEPGVWHPASVPGAVQLDIAAAEGLPDYAVGENARRWAWLEDRAYVYRTQFTRPALEPGESLHFCAEGIDYEAVVLINGRPLLRHVGPYTAVEVDLTPHLQPDNELRVRIEPAPKRHPSPVDRSQAAHVVKPAVNYGWDFHPRLIPLGLWKEARLERRPSSHLQRVELTYTLAEDLTAARLQLHLTGQGVEGRTLRVVLKEPSGRVALSVEHPLIASTQQTLTLGEVSAPRLWWPRSHGEQARYPWTADLLGPDGRVIASSTGRVGFRRVRLVMNEGTWLEPAVFPKTRSHPPIQVEMNGRRIFCKGSNWVPPDVFPGRIKEATYRGLVALAADAHLDLLRVWGGGGVMHETFYEACDEAGVLVWQEFPLACNNYPDDPAYLAVLHAEARSIVRQLRAHACLALWCGGNELFNHWSGMTDQSRALRLLNAVCLELDPETPFIPTAPLEGMGHGHYLFYDWDKNEEVFTRMTRARNTAYSEFAIPGPAPVDTIRAVIPPEELWPPKPGGAWESHHAFASWTAETWLCLATLERYFGPTPDLQSLVERGQLMQAQGLKAIFEEARRQKPYCSMALNWCFNDAWPNVANGSLVAYQDQPKPAYHAVAESCRPVLASARFNQWRWAAGELFSAELWILNDATEPPSGAVAAGRARAVLVGPGETRELLAWNFPELPANTNHAGPVARTLLPDWQTHRFVLRVEVEGRPHLASDYTLLFQPKAARAPGPAEPVTRPLNL